MEELVYSMEGFEELDNMAEWENVVLNDFSYHLFSDWYIKTVEINKKGASVFTKRNLYDINEIEKL